MKSLIRWSISNTPAMNMLMLTVLAVGTFCLVVMQRETFPQFRLEIVLISVPYPGATPAEVEEGICQKIEEQIRALDGVKKMTSVAAEGAGSVVLELTTSADVEKVVNDVRSAVDRIPSFPAEAEDPEIQQITLREPAITIGVLAPAGTDQLMLRDVTEKVRSELLALKSVSQVGISNERKYQIDIEVSEDALRKHGLTLTQVADIVRANNVELPAGSIRTSSGEILLRGLNKRVTGEEIAKLPLLEDPLLTVGDIANVKDEFEDTAYLSQVNGQEAMVLTVNRTDEEDLLVIAEEVRDYIDDTELEGGFELIYWADRSVDVKDRLDMLVENGVMGLVLVFVILTLFLEFKLAFWVALGIPVSMLGAGAVLLAMDQTLNMLTMFAFLMALGIVVDDAIVVGENIYAHRNMGKGYLQAAIDGTVEVVPSVIASVATTVIAFTPLMFVSGVMGKFFAVMPLAIIAMLIISLLESTFILPCHLAHKGGLFDRIFDGMFYKFWNGGKVIDSVSHYASNGLDIFINKAYSPALNWTIANRWIAASLGLVMLILTTASVMAGFVGSKFFPELDSNELVATVEFENGTPEAVARAATEELEKAIWEVNEEQKRASGSDQDLVKVAYRTVGEVTSEGPRGMESSGGSHLGQVSVQLVSSEQRNVKSTTITDEWREKVSGRIHGAESLKIGPRGFGPGGAQIEFKLLADKEHFQELKDAVLSTKLYLYPIPEEELTDEEKKHVLMESDIRGTYNVQDDHRPGKVEYQAKIKESALSTGITNNQLNRAIRAAFYGEEVMRLQRGRHEVKLMVRYPEEERRSSLSLNELEIRADDGMEYPITEIAEFNIDRGPTEFNRVNQLRSITITGQVSEDATMDGNAIVKQMQEEFLPKLFEKYPNVTVRLEGQAEQQKESMSSLAVGMVIALMIMFVLLTLQFKSYAQPLLIMAIIPFGAIGAILGHGLLGIPITLFSMFGLVALAGVVVNDSIVLIDFINHRVRDGIPIDDALQESGVRRFRPVLLTSATTIAGLLPILLETSFQAQILIPMATSLAFGLLVATLLVLLLIPAFYRIYWDLLGDPASHEDDDLAAMDAEIARAQAHNNSGHSTRPAPVPSTDGESETEKEEEEEYITLRTSPEPG